MSNNKLKNMIENHELDDFITNKELNNKLRNSKTSEKVLELLKKYNYNESREVFEVELMDLLQEFVDEEELLKVSGGKINKKSFSNIVTSLALTGALCMPVQGVTGVSNSEKAKNKKSSYSVGLPPKEKVVTGATGVVLTIGLGKLLISALANKSEKTNKNGNEHGHETHQLYTDITDDRCAAMHGHFMKIATRPKDCTPADFKKYTTEELRQFMLRELIEWMKCMGQHCLARQKNGTNEYYLDYENRENVIKAWNQSLDRLVCAYLACIIRKQLFLNSTDEILECYTQCSVKTELPAAYKSDGLEVCQWEYTDVPYALLGQSLLDADLLGAVKPKNLSAVLRTIMNGICYSWQENNHRIRMEMDMPYVAKLKTLIIGSSYSYADTTDWKKMMERYEKNMKKQ